MKQHSRAIGRSWLNVRKLKEARAKGRTGTSGPILKIFRLHAKNSEKLLLILREDSMIGFSLSNRNLSYVK